MRIAHVATLLAEDAAYGGPLTVAMEQCAELAARCHDVSLYVGWDGAACVAPDLGFDVIPCRVHKIVPGNGVAGMFSLGMLCRLRRDLPRFDVVHIHFGRDLVAVAAAASVSGRRPMVLQTHGMVMPDQRPQARALDALTVRRSLRSARAVLYLTERERAGLEAVSREAAALMQLDNGIGNPSSASDRDPASRLRRVLFCARLHPRKRPRAFVEMSEAMQRHGVQCEFRMAGPDEGELADVEDRIESARSAGVDIAYVGALSASAARDALAAADVFVLPSDDEPFPMTVLEAMSLGTPTVVTESCGLADLLRSEKAAAVSAREPHALADEVSRLITDDSAWSDISRRGRALIETRLSVSAVADRLEDIYAAAIEKAS